MMLLPLVLAEGEGIAVTTATERVTVYVLKEDGRDMIFVDRTEAVA